MRSLPRTLLLIPIAASTGGCQPIDIDESAVREVWVGSVASTKRRAADEAMELPDYPFPGLLRHYQPVVCWVPSNEGGVACRSVDLPLEATVEWEAPGSYSQVLYTPFGPTWITRDGAFGYELRCPTDIEDPPPCGLAASRGLNRLLRIEDPEQISTTGFQVCVLDARGQVDCHAGFVPPLGFEATSLHTADGEFWTCAVGAEGQHACWDHTGTFDTHGFPSRVSAIEPMRAPCALDARGALRCAAWPLDLYFPESPGQLDVDVAVGVTSISSAAGTLVFEVADAHYLTDNAISMSSEGPCTLPEPDTGAAGTCGIKRIEGGLGRAVPPCVLSDRGRLRCDSDFEGLVGAWP